MRQAKIFIGKQVAGLLEEFPNHIFRFSYEENYQGQPLSLTMPTTNRVYEFDRFPPFFEGLLPEGVMLEALLRKYKLDRDDYFGQLLVVGKDVVGAAIIEELR